MQQSIASGSRAIVVALALGGCVTGSAVVRPNRVSLPLLAGAIVADFAVTALVASRAQDYTTGSSILTGLAVTSLDTAVGCVLGACSSLKP